METMNPFQITDYQQFARDILAQEAELDQEMVSRSFKMAIRTFWSQVETDEFIHDWYIDVIADHLEAVSRFEIKNLVICIPPRHTKSLIVSVLFPVWVWIKNPKQKFIFSSYAHALALRDARKTRSLIESEWFQERWPTVKIAADQNRIERYELKSGGYRFSTSVQGQLTGEGGDFSICDDPHNVKEAESDLTRQGTVSWWKESMSSRLNNMEKSSKVIIQQRVHQGDLAGEMIEEGYQKLILPAEYEPDHPEVSIHDMRTVPGEILSSRFKKADLEMLQKSLGDYAYAGQYQQRPAPRGGGIFKVDCFKSIQKEHLPEKFDQVVSAWDFAATEKSKSDWTVRTKMGRIHDSVHGDLFYIIDVRRFKASGGKLRNAIKSIVQLDGDGVLIDMPLDPAAAGKEWATSLRTLLMGYPVTFSPERGDKVLRSQGYASAVELGNVYLVKADWNKPFIDEHKVFDAGKWDDQIDSTGRAFRRLTLGRKQRVSAAVNDPVRQNTVNPAKSSNLEDRKVWDEGFASKKGKRSRFSPRWRTEGVPSTYF